MWLFANVLTWMKLLKYLELCIVQANYFRDLFASQIDLPLIYLYIKLEMINLCYISLHRIPENTYVVASWSVIKKKEKKKLYKQHSSFLHGP